MKKLRGEITIEISIVLPVVMMVVTLLIFASFYAHDSIAVKSYAYAAGVENIEEDFTDFEKAVKEKMENTPVLVLKYTVSCSRDAGYYSINIAYNEDIGVGWLNTLMGNSSGTQTIKIEKKISKEILYGFRGINDWLKQDE